MKAKQEVIAHNVGFNRPFLTHSQYVHFLYECAAYWNTPPDAKPEQALRVQAKAIEAEKQGVAGCEVCQWVLKAKN